MYETIDHMYLYYNLPLRNGRQVNINYCSCRPNLAILKVDFWICMYFDDDRNEDIYIYIAQIVQEIF